MLYRNLLLFFLTIAGCLTFSYAAIKMTGYSGKLNGLALISDDPLSTSITTQPMVSTPSSEKMKNAIQIALLLDTSGSMNGLLEQAKTQLWNILSELSETKKGEETPSLEIALYEYGNPNKASEKYEINQLSPFTTDMDAISEKLFSLRTNGGAEYCGAVIKSSLENLDWTDSEGLRMIYIAGNEPFNQGPVAFRPECEKAKNRGILVNTIYCSDGVKGDNQDWRTGANVGGGEFFTINHNDVTEFVETPYDDAINILNEELNVTYHSFNSYGESKRQNIYQQDNNAGIYSKENVVKRAKFKSSKQYNNEDWDLVENYRKDKKILEKAVILDEKLSKLSKPELEKEIEEMGKKREEVKKKILDLDKKRMQYKKDKTKTNPKNNLGNSIIKTVKKQAKSKGFDVKE